MSQQILPSRLRKGFLVIGIALLILSFFFFYWASRVDWDYHSINHYSVTTQDFLSYGDTTSYNFSNSFGSVEQKTVREYHLHSVVMNKDDNLLVEYNGGTNLGPSHIVLYSDENIVAQSGDTSSSLVWFTSESDYKVISIYITVPFDGNFTNLSTSLSTQGSLSATLTLDHYETPHWIYFGIGVVLSSLAVIPIFKSKTTAKS